MSERQTDEVIERAMALGRKRERLLIVRWLQSKEPTPCLCVEWASQAILDGQHLASEPK